MRPGDMMSCVVIVGIPYMYPDKITEAKIAYYDEVFNNQGWVFGYLSPAMQRANQASGRPIRKLNDRGVIVFLDERFIERKGWISHWVQKEIKAAPDKPNILYKVISEFWNEG
jgi:Rad3-related DNA helicase